MVQAKNAMALHLTIRQHSPVQIFFQSSVCRTRAGNAQCSRARVERCFATMDQRFGRNAHQRQCLSCLQMHPLQNRNASQQGRWKRRQCMCCRAHGLPRKSCGNILATAWQGWPMKVRSTLRWTPPDCNRDAKPHRVFVQNHRCGAYWASTAGSHGQSDAGHFDHQALHANPTKYGGRIEWPTSQRFRDGACRHRHTCHLEMFQISSIQMELEWRQNLLLSRP
mmetsp:Transcript_72483/g.136908  ORF Transcript_72483/g.136908 Transcript_72483/m.136908 type:complete len:223 (+) Transcript_72483:1158-1826(+)